MKIVRLYAIACVIAGLLLIGCNKPAPQPTTQQKSDTKTTQPAQPAATTAPAKPVETVKTAAPSKPAEPNAAKAGATDEVKYIREPDVIYVPTPVEVVDKMLEMAKVTKNDVLYDLGCGTGTIVIEAAKKIGCRCVGFEIEPERVKKARANVDANGVGNLVRIEQKDIFTLDLSPASVVTLYLLPTLNVKLIPQLEKLKPGSRIVSHDFDMQGVQEDQKVTVETKESSPYGGTTHEVYLWSTPLKKVPVAQ